MRRVSRQPSDRHINQSSYIRERQHNNNSWSYDLRLVGCWTLTMWSWCQSCHLMIKTDSVNVSRVHGCIETCFVLDEEARDVTAIPPPPPHHSSCHLCTARTHKQTGTHSFGKCLTSSKVSNMIMEEIHAKFQKADFPLGN